MNFKDILDIGKEKFKVKRNGQWGKCDGCDNRKILFKYSEDDKYTWMICSHCLDSFFKSKGKK